MFQFVKNDQKKNKQRSKATVTMSFQTNQRLGFTFFDHSKPAEEYVFFRASPAKLEPDLKWTAWWLNQPI